MWKNMVERGRSQMTIWHMRVACWIPKAKDTHSEYVIRFLLFNCNNGLHQRASILCYTFIGCFANFCYCLSKIPGNLTWRSSLLSEYIPSLITPVARSQSIYILIFNFEITVYSAATDCDVVYHVATPQGSLCCPQLTASLAGDTGSCCNSSTGCRVQQHNTWADSTRRGNKRIRKVIIELN